MKAKEILILMTAFLFSSFLALDVNAQNNCMGDYPGSPMSSSGMEAWKAWCTRHGGTLTDYDAAGNPTRCDPGPNWCKDQSYGRNEGQSTHRSMNGPRNWNAGREAEEQREAERSRAREREAAEARRKQAEFEKEKRDALRGLKGISTETEGLKNAGTIHDTSTPIFGLKGVGDTGIKNVAPARGSRDVSTAWKQLHCAAEISRYLLRDADGPSGSIDLAEVHYLAGQAIAALNGESLGVQCSPAPPFPNFGARKTPGPVSLTTFYREMVGDIVREAETISAANRALAELQVKRKHAEERLRALRAERPYAPRGVPADKGETEQKVKEVEQQKQRQSAMREALAALREAQELTREEDAKKARALRVLHHYEQKNDQILGNSGGQPGP